MACVGCIKKEDCKSIIKLSLPLGFSYAVLFFVPLISLQFSGHKEKDFLAAIGLGISFGNAFGFTVVIGVERAFQTLCSQAFGAGNFRRMGILLQRSLVILLISSLPFLAIWVNAEAILRGFKQDENVCRTTGEFLTWYMPAIWLFGSFRLLFSFLACQHRVYPQIFSGIIACVTSVISNYICSFILDAGIPGYAISTELAYLAGCIALVGSIKCCRLIRCWPGWSVECLEEWGQFATLAAPSWALIFLDWGGSEAGVILMGLLGTTNLAAMSAAFNILTFLYVFCQGVAISACVKVGNHLGAGELAHAKRAAKVAVTTTVTFTATIAITLLLCKDYIGYIFTSDRSVVKLLSNINPLLAAYHFLDGNVATFNGILNGLGLQKYSAPVALFGYDCVGLPLGLVFAFVLKMGLFGFWSGQVSGAVCMISVSILIVIKSNWKACLDLAVRRAKVKKVDQSQEEAVEKDTDASGNEKIPLVESKSWQYYSNGRSTSENQWNIFGRVCVTAVSFSLFLIGIALKLLT